MFKERISETSAALEQTLAMVLAANWFLTVLALAHASSPKQCEDAQRVQLRAPEELKAQPECSPDDIGCMARQLSS